MKAVVFQLLISLLIVSVCSWRRQSPINIETDKIVPSERELDIFYHYPPDTRVVVYKNDHTVNFVPERISDDFIVHFEGEIYIFSGLHFHWGEEDAEGSEHTINGMRYSMEAHLVFYKLIYGSKEEAMKQQDGFVVIGLFLQAGGTDNIEFENVSKIVMDSVATDDSITVTAIEAYKWLIYSLERKSKYYTYPGSLTTPPYTENVQWFVFGIIIPISSQQVGPFRRLKYEGNKLTPNFREIQPINFRTVYSSHYYNLYTE